MSYVFWLSECHQIIELQFELSWRSSEFLVTKIEKLWKDFVRHHIKNPYRSKWKTKKSISLDWIVVVNLNFFPSQKLIRCCHLYNILVIAFCTPIGQKLHFEGWICCQGLVKGNNHKRKCSFQLYPRALHTIFYNTKNHTFKKWKNTSFVKNL